MLFNLYWLATDENIPQRGYCFRFIKACIFTKNSNAISFVKKIIKKIHLILGLIIGAVIIVVSLTGCIYAFQNELQNLTQPYRFIEKKTLSFLPPDQLKAIALHELPGKKVNRLHYGKKNEAAIIGSYGPDYYFRIYLNPYTGHVLKVKDMNSDFFRFILNGHFYLWLPPDIGKPVVSIATLAFVFMIISGIILWWPGSKAATKQRFSIKWNAKWRRKNYDLHNVLGFYSSFVLLCISITGLVWGFEWFSKSFYRITSGGKTLVEWSPAVSDTTKANQPIFIPSSMESKSPVNFIWAKTATEHPGIESIDVDFPGNKKGAIGISVNSDATTYWKSDNRFYDQYTLKEINVKHVYGRFNDKLTAADKIRRMNYDIHVGAILGLPGKFLAFFASLICASLPVTGFMIWYGRRYKQKTKRIATDSFIKYAEFKGLQVTETIEIPQPQQKKKFRLRKKSHNRN